MAKIYKGIKELKTNKIRFLALLAVLRCRQKYDIDVVVSETYRTQERQNELYAQGRITPGNKVTWTKKSIHTSRKALDVYPIREGILSTKDEDYKKFATIFKAFGFENGYDWKETQDKPHHEFNGAASVTYMTKKEVKYLFIYISCLNRGYKKKYGYLKNGAIGKGKKKFLKSEIGINSDKLTYKQGLRILENLLPKLYGEYYEGKPWTI